MTGGSSAVWVFVYCIWYYMFKLHITGFVSSLLFFSYSFLACVVYGLLTGTVGFLTAYVFVRRIYRYVSISPSHSSRHGLTVAVSSRWTDNTFIDVTTACGVWCGLVFA